MDQDRIVGAIRKTTSAVKEGLSAKSKDTVREISGRKH